MQFGHRSLHKSHPSGQHALLHGQNAQSQDSFDVLNVHSVIGQQVRVSTGRRLVRQIFQAPCSRTERERASHDLRGDSVPAAPAGIECRV